jgi:outer membrane protein assembly factor BamB
MQNGDLVVGGGRPAPAELPPRPDGKTPIARFAARIAWEGDLVWLRDVRVHHQLDLTPESEVIVLSESQRSIEEVGRRAASLTPGVDEDLVFHDNDLIWLSTDGEVNERLSLLDAVTTGPLDFGFLPRDELLETRAHVGLFHANSAYAMDQPHLAGTHPLFSEQNVLVTSRNQNRIFVVDRKSRSLVWEWGRDELQAPHDATWLGNGHMLVFDNGVERESSRILEVEPKTGRVVWKYPGATGDPFHSTTRGQAQRLVNGNTLITNSEAGEAFEVTPAGRIVWQYFAPVPAGSERRPVLMSVHRYPESWLQLRGVTEQREDP